MSDYISRQAAIDVLAEGMCGDLECKIHEKIKALPSADVRENVRGEWIDFGHDFYGDYEYKCSSCGMTANYTTDFCPNCGADMRGGQDGK